MKKSGGVVFLERGSTNSQGKYLERELEMKAYPKENFKKKWHNFCIITLLIPKLKMQGVETFIYSDRIQPRERKNKGEFKFVFAHELSKKMAQKVDQVKLIHSCFQHLNMCEKCVSISFPCRDVLGFL